MFQYFRLAVLTAFILTVGLHAAFAANWYVATNGNDAANGSAASPWRTIAHAAAQPLQPGDQVLVAPGTYPEAIALTRSGAQIVPVTTGVTVAGTDTIRLPAGTDISGIDLAAHPGEYRLYVYRSWRANNGVFTIVATGSDGAGPWVQVLGADFVDEAGVAADARYLSAAVGRPIVFRNASDDPANQRVTLDASTKPAIYTMLYIGRYLDYDDAEPVNWNIVDGIDGTGSHQGGGVHVQDSSFNVVMNCRFYNLNGAGILVAGNQDQPSRYNMIWKNTLYNTPTEGIYVGAGGHGAAANHDYYTHVIGNDISTQGTAANATMENAIDLKEYNKGDLVAGNLIHDYALISQSNGAIDIRDGKQDVLVYNNVLRNIGKANNGPSSVIHLYAGSKDVQIFNNVLVDTTGVGANVYAFNVDGGGSSGILIAHNSVRGFNQGILLEQYGGTTDVRFQNNVFDFANGGIEEWGNAGRFTFSHNLYNANPGAYATEPSRLIASPGWVNPTNPTVGDLHLDSGSVAIDTALNLTAVPVDIERALRPSGNASDRGAYELQTGVQSPPTANFSAAPLAGIAPLAVQFTDASSGATGWLWNFGDGTTSSLSAPSHTYTAPGSYTVTLVVTNANGDNTLTRSGLIVVTAPAAPTVAFTATPTSGTAPLTVQFTDQSSATPTSWAWTFGDGSTSSAQAPSHVYAVPGTYNVTLTTTNAYGSGTLTRSGLVVVTAPGVRQTVFFDGFETGLKGWYKQGKATWYAGDPKHGTHALRFTGNNVWAERGVSTVGYTNIVLSVALGAKSFENWEYLIVYWTDGQKWYEPITIDNHHPAANGQLNPIEVPLPASAANNPNLRIAFGMWDTDTGDFAYIDDVMVTGVPVALAP